VAGTVKSEDGTNPEGHIWRIAPTRRDLLGFLGWGAVLSSIGIGTLAFVRFMYPRVLFEPPSQFKLGRPTEYAPLSTSEKWIKALRLWVVRYDDRFIAISAICTHLGCTPRYLGTEDKYKCPCHGSGYRGFASGWKVNATNFEGPAPRPMERFKLALADDGQMVVDKSATFRIDKLEFDKPGAYLPFA
jgi:cytochrome b6-f complex iron-sulfur subunit